MVAKAPWAIFSNNVVLQNTRLPESLKDRRVQCSVVTRISKSPAKVAEDAALRFVVLHAGCIRVELKDVGIVVHAHFYRGIEHPFE